MRPRIGTGTFVLALALAAAATGEDADDASSLAPTFEEGDVIRFGQIDRQTFAPMYSFAYDRKDELWKTIWHNKRWSQDESLTGEWFPGWKEVPNPRTLVVISDLIANVQTGTGNRIEFWDAHATPLSTKGRIRRYIDVGRLTKGR